MSSLIYIINYMYILIDIQKLRIKYFTTPDRLYLYFIFKLDPSYKNFKFFFFILKSKKCILLKNKYNLNELKK